jgi:hypothetical protein
MLSSTVENISFSPKKILSLIKQSALLLVLMFGITDQNAIGIMNVKFKMFKMKKLQIALGLGAVCAMFLFNSCETTTNPVPVISYDQTSPIVLGIGEDAVTLTGSIVAEAGLSTVKIYKTVGLSESLIETITDFGSGIVTTSDNINYDFTLGITDLTAETTIKITAIDKDAQEVSESIVIQVTEGTISSFTAILLGGQTNAEPSCLDANTGTRYSVNQSASADVIDFVYYYGATNLATIAAPNDPSVNGTGVNALNWTNDWDPQNATLFGSSSLVFATVTYAELSAITGLTDSKENELAIDDVIAFQTVDGKKGIAVVTDLTTGTSGSITLNVKIQE